MSLLASFAIVVSAVVFAIFCGAWLLGVRYIPHTKVGIVEKLWASKGSLKDGRIVAAQDEAGYQGPVPEKNPEIYAGWQAQMRSIRGFQPFLAGTGSVVVPAAPPVPAAAPSAAEARRLAERDVARAEGEGRARELLGRGEASRIAQTGVAEAGVFLKKIRAYGDPRLCALNLLTEPMARSQQPLVPERVLMMGGGGQDGATAGVSLFGRVMALLLSEKGGIGVGAEDHVPADVEQFVDTLTGAAKPAAPAGQA